MADYPGTITSFTTKTDKEDLYSASHINDPQSEIVAIETELGTDVAGSATDLKTRLAVSLANTGAIANGTSFPVSPTPIDGQIFYRTDEDTLYVYNGSSWESAPSFTARAFSFCFGGDYTVNDYGVVLSDSANPTAAEIQKLSWAVQGTTFRSIIKSKFKKLAGVSTITCYARIANSSGTSTVQVTIGGNVGSNTRTTSSTLDWTTSFTVDVSGLSNGTVYDMSVELKAPGATPTVMDSIVGFAS